MRAANTKREREGEAKTGVYESEELRLYCTPVFVCVCVCLCLSIIFDPDQLT